VKDIIEKILKESHRRTHCWVGANWLAKINTYGSCRELGVRP